MTNYTQPHTWTASTAYTANQSEVLASVGTQGYYYICTTSGTSGGSTPSWSSIFGTTITDGTVTWICAQRQRNNWVANSQYTGGLPLQTTGTVSINSASITSIAGGASFIGLGAYVIGNQIPGSTQISAVPAASTAVMNMQATQNGSNETLWFFNLEYPLPDQIITAAVSGSPVVQCLVSGQAGGSQPTWPTTLGASVSDGTVTWVTVGIN